MKKVLILEPYNAQSFSISRFIKRYSDYYIVAHVENQSTHANLINNNSYFDSFSKREIDQNYLSKFDYIFPGGAASTELLINLLGEIKLGNIRFDKNSLKAYDKILMFRICEELSIPYPLTYTSLEQSVPIPFFYKQKNEYVEGKGKYRGIVKSKKGKSQLKSPEDLIFQEYIPGYSTYSYTFLADKGEVLTEFMFEEKFSQPISGGNGVLLEKIEDSRLKALSLNLIKKLDYSGWGMVEFKYCKKREDYVFMELNSKFWASIEFAIMNNNQFMKLLFDIDHPRENVRSVIFIHRLLNLFCFKYIKFLPEILKAKKISHGWKKNYYSFFRKYLKP